VLRLNGIKSLTVEARSNVLQAAGYTTRRYVKLLRRIVEEPFSVCPARSSRRQEGVLLQGHPRPWPVAKPRTLRVPAHKVPGTYYRQCCASVFPRFQLLWCAGILPPPRTPALDKEVVLVRCAPVGNSLVVAPVLGRSAAKDQAVGGTASLVFVVSTPRYGFAVFIYTCPLFLHTSAVVNHAGSVEGVQGQPFRLLAQRMSGSAFGGLWPPRLIALSAHNHAFASARHPLRRWVPFSLGFAHGRYPFDSALSRARWARTPEAVCAHILPVFAGGREPGVSRPLYRQSPPFLTR
jgi:hypothetical protein